MSKFKKMNAPIIIFDMDGSIRFTDLDGLVNTKREYIEYVLFKNPDDDNYFIVEGSKFIGIKEADIDYTMINYVSYNDEFGDDVSSDEYIEGEHHAHVNNCIEFYTTLWNVFKMRMVYTLMMIGFEVEDRCGFIISEMNISVKLDTDELITFEWKMNYEVTDGSNVVKLSKLLFKKFKIPNSELSFSEKCFLITSNNWQLVPVDSIKKTDLIGYISDTLMTVSFTTMNDLKCIISSWISVDVYCTELTSVVNTYSDYLANKNNQKYLLGIDVDDIPVLYNTSFTLHMDNDRVTFFSNLHYFFKYLKGSLAIPLNVDINKVECIMSIVIDNDTLVLTDGIDVNF